MASSVNDGNLNLAIIAYAKARPCIWDNSARYSKSERDEAWRSFSEGFSLPVSELRKRWEGMRQMYCQHLKESIAESTVIEWPYFSKLDEFLRNPSLRGWEKECTIPEKGSTHRTKDIQCIDLSSDSDVEPNENAEATAGVVNRVDSSEKNIERPPGNGVALQTAGDIGSEVRKVPPVAGSIGGLQKPLESRNSTGVLQKSKPSTASHDSKTGSLTRKPSLGLGTKRKSPPHIPDAKRRLIQTYSELIPLKKVDPNDNLSRSLPLVTTSTISSPPHKMFGSTSANVASKHKPTPSSAPSIKSSTKAIKRKVEKGSRKTPKKSIAATAPPSTSSTGNANLAAGEANKLTLSSEITKLPPCTDITMVPSRSELPKVHLTPLSEGVTLHSVPVTSGEESRITKPDVPREDRLKERVKCKKKKKKTKEHMKGKLQKVRKEVTDLIVLDNSDTEVTTSIPEPPKTSTIKSDRQNTEEHGKPDSNKAENDLLKRWAEESKELRKTEDEVEGQQEKDDPEAAREDRKNFLLSFLPDMAEMTVEQRRFFKSKLMYLVCNIDQFS